MIPAALDHYELTPARTHVPVTRRDVSVQVWAADRFGKLIAEGGLGLFVVTGGVCGAAGFPGVEGQRGEGADRTNDGRWFHAVGSVGVMGNGMVGKTDSPGLGFHVISGGCGSCGLRG